MKIYISGITGTGMGPLAMMAADTGLSVSGSDLAEGMLADELTAHHINFQIGPQDGAFLQQQLDAGAVDWFVYTSALPADHPELLLAQKAGLRTSKRDELISFLIDKLNLKMVAVAGTHGKTTTTAMLIWVCHQLDIPTSYLIGTTLPFAAAGRYDPSAQYFLYEADEYDRNFLHFHPWLSLITTVSYDHPDIYPTKADYQQAFQDFETQSGQVIYGGDTDPRITLAGAARREDATLALKALEKFTDQPTEKLIHALNQFPGVGRRFERLVPGIYTDYGHHPEEVATTVALAREQADRDHHTGVAIIYQPHQNTRQHSIRQGYKNAFQGAGQLFWLPTYLTREDESLPILTPADFIQDLANPAIAHPAELDDQLLQQLQKLHAKNYLILLLTAGPADAWLRQAVSAGQLS